MNTLIIKRLNKEIKDLEHEKYKKFYEFIKVINKNITYEESKLVYDTANSIRNSNVSRKGKIFESIIREVLEEHKLNFKEQVYLDMRTKMFTKTRTSHVIDFVVHPDVNKNIYGSSICECIILSCKYTCRERYKEDDKITMLNPLKYYLLVATNDYPRKFTDNEKQCIITLCPKDNDDRLTFDNFIDDLKRTMKQYVPKQSMPLKFIDLCCGIGSFHYSMLKTNPESECVMACDILESARSTYEYNYKHIPLCDLKDINFNDYKADVLFSGNPCQAFSQIGKHKGFIDERGDLFNYILDKIVALETYNVIVFENVYGLYTHDGGKTFEYIIGELRKYNYKVITKILTCSDYGIPQNRKRIFIICLHSRKFGEEVKHYENILDNILATRKDNKVRLTEYLNNGYVFQKKVAYTIRCGGASSPIDSKQNWDGYIVEDKEGKQLEYRLTTDDMKRLQGFDVGFKLCGSKSEQKKLLGNSIPTNLTNIMTTFIYTIY